MHMKNFYLIVFIFLTASLLIRGQGNYYATDSTLKFGAKLVNGGDIVNSRLCQVVKDGRIVKYTPGEIREYGFKNGQVYVSREIPLSGSIQRVFLERLHKGNTSIYYYCNEDGKTYFLEKSAGSLVEIPKTMDGRNYKEQLQTLTDDCRNASEATRYVRYSKKPMAKLISIYDQCLSRPFPRLRFGVNTGYEFSRLATVSAENEYVNDMDFRYEGVFTAGLFIDYPINVSDFSFHAGVGYSQHEFSYSKFVQNTDIDVFVNLSSLKIPVLVRYSVPASRIRPFLNAGCIFASHFRNENIIHETRSDLFKEIDASLISSRQTGLSGGAGVEARITKRHSLFIELRHNILYSQMDSKKMKCSDLQLLTGIIF